MKKLNFLVFGTIFSVIFTLCLSTNLAFATSNDENTTLRNNDSLTQSKTAPTIPPTIQDPKNTEDPAGYWTKEKMKNAIPADKIKNNEKKEMNPEQFESSLLGEPTNISDPVLPETNNNLNEANVVVPSTAGKVFFSYGGKDYVCSASSINNNYKNLVITAGHCVNGGKGKGWHSNIAFAPAYRNGSTPYGIWNWKEARTFNAWINDSNFSYDQAFFTVFPRNGKDLVNTIGGNGLSTGYGTNQPDVRIFGWPAEKPYDGQIAHYCDGPTTSRGWFSSDAAMKCGMNGGASGGPWLRERINQDLGYVFAVTSRRSTSGTPTLYATPNSKDVKTMFDQMK
ncbi:trypsin-like serine peptidase [Bacillus sp. S10(2024)]|uniref:trypsin-like serine peptidase n=1 Tax=Bacillus sp. S10(2024) TaxID=3162886 RepID=UPI003D1B0532